MPKEKGLINILCKISRRSKFLTKFIEILYNDIKKHGNQNMKHGQEEDGIFRRLSPAQGAQITFQKYGPKFLTIFAFILLIVGLIAVFLMALLSVYNFVAGIRSGILNFEDLTKKNMVECFSSFLECAVMFISIILYAFILYDFCRIYEQKSKDKTDEANEEDSEKNVYLIIRIVLQAVFLQFIILIPIIEKNIDSIGVVNGVLLFMLITLFLVLMKYIAIPLLDRIGKLIYEKVKNTIITKLDDSIKSTNDDSLNKVSSEESGLRNIG